MVAFSLLLELFFSVRVVDPRHMVPLLIVHTLPENGLLYRMTCRLIGLYFSKIYSASVEVAYLPS